MSAKDYTGKRFGRLVVIKRIAKKREKTKYLCECDCGNKHVVAGSCLTNRQSRSCGCLKRQLIIKKNTTHGMTGTSEHYIWKAMKDRCGNEKNKCFKDYGGRGITVCARWLSSFENFYSDMGPKPSSNYSIDRKDNDGDYSPENCRWATKKEQTRNARSNHNITFNGHTHCIAEWAEKQGMNYQTLRQRIAKYGWSIERALTEPVPTYHKRVKLYEESA